MDVFTPEFRSEVMKRVRRSRTADEELLHAALRRVGIRVRRNVASLPGSPDFVATAARLVVFVDGDFWHGRPWFTRRAAPKSNRRFWIERFESNRKRDRRVDRRLRALGWKVMRVWGTDVRKDPGRVAERVARRLVLAGRKGTVQVSHGRS
jgi:DNA mismatch endonuclease (patch repair protein)